MRKLLILIPIILIGCKNPYSVKQIIKRGEYEESYVDTIQRNVYSAKQIRSHEQARKRRAMLNGADYETAWNKVYYLGHEWNKWELHPIYYHQYYDKKSNCVIEKGDRKTTGYVVTTQVSHKAEIFPEMEWRHGGDYKRVDSMKCLHLEWANEYIEKKLAYRDSVKMLREKCE